ncbi:hypothetical protein C3F09_09630 [candidate division GN15 bacterium]|uniref:Inositolphosphotransferase Aur1/Ipt1 domain-containing protein n=1 Tax=candidate division GN15 bacterium TaxID=2072418 RepID=A0A855WXG3_9BACT|nr:MAG: hypothetical protein C3F09_09630 [candidate division GN15 bacterium]
MNASHSSADPPVDSVAVRASGTVAGKILYGVLFVILLPVALILWAYFLDSTFEFAVPHAGVTGVPVAVLGTALMILGAAALWLFGRGLPMNPFPPKEFVSRGVYRWLAHPMYTGFCLCCAGVSVCFGSGGGFWIITPVVILGCVAIVYGYERQDLDQRFGRSRAVPLIRLPAMEESALTWNDRLSAYLLVLLPWAIGYELAVFIGAPRDAASLTFAFEKRIDVLEWTEIIYASTYIWVILTPLLLKTRTQLRDFAVSGILATVAGIGLFFLLPVVHEPRIFEPHGPLGRLLLWERAHDTSAAAFPAFHVIWALLTARAWAQAFRPLKWFWFVWAIAIAASCITTGQHSLLDLAGALLIVLLAWNRRTVWNGLRYITERLANSWREWRLGPLRIINHSIYSGLAAFVGLSIVSVLLPSIGLAALFGVIAAGIIGGALFAQIVEGSPRLLRPFGYFGTIIGGCLSVVLVSLLPETDGSLLLCALAIAAPFTQAVGRLRCLVQGCCHGRAAESEHQGIKYWHPSTRVVHLSPFANIPIHPTPLYSILWNLAVGLVLVRLWFMAVPENLITGLYFLLVGIGRFVEEAYRGEPQTPKFLGLRLYQWCSVAFVVTGMITSSIPSNFTPASVGWRWELLVPALAGGLMWAAAMSMDFPRSHRRYARLTG